MIRRVKVADRQINIQTCSYSEHYLSTNTERKAAFMKLLLYTRDRPIDNATAPLIKYTFFLYKNHICQLRLSLFIKYSICHFQIFLKICYFFNIFCVEFKNVLNFAHLQINELVFDTGFYNAEKNLR